MKSRRLNIVRVSVQVVDSLEHDTGFTRQGSLVQILWSKHRG